jgi:hypothetical protein
VLLGLLVAAGLTVALARGAFEAAFPSPRGAAAAAEVAREGWVLAALAAAALAVVVVARARFAWAGRWRPALPAILAAIAAVDILLAGLPLRWTAPQDLLRAPSPLVAARGERTRRDPDLDRYALPRHREDWYAMVRAARASLRPNASLLDGASLWVGFGAFFPGDLNLLLATCPEQAERLARSLGVTRVVRAGPGGPRLEQDPAARPRVRLEFSARIEPDSLSRGCRLLESSGDSLVVDAREVLRQGERAQEDVPALLRDLPGKGQGTARLREETPERLVLEVRAGAPALLVVGDTFFPGWRAKVDGREAPILRASLVGRAIPVGPGSHEVELWYEPLALKTGLRISLVSLTAILAGALLLWAARRRERAKALSKLVSKKSSP